jgi:hypothetical protein
MSDPTETFKEWLKTRRLKAKQVCKPLKISEQTVHNWFAIGIPKRRWEDVNDLMRTWRDDAISAPVSLDQPLVVIPTREQFLRWNEASAAQGITVEKWAIEGLDQLASEYFDEQEERARRADLEALEARSRLKIEVDETPYQVKKAGDSGSGN